MNTLDESAGGGILRRMVHCWDTQAHRMVCGVRQQIGSTKHVRDVTCKECLELLRAARPQVHLVPG